MAATLWKSLIICWLVSFSATTSYRILIYNPQISRSHVAFLSRIADTLAEVGHDVVVYLPSLSKHVNVTEVQLARTLIRPLDFDSNCGSNETDFWGLRGQSLTGLWKLFQTFGEPMMKLCERQLKDKRLMDKLRKEKFEVAVAEAIDPCFYLLVRLLHIPVHISAYATPILEGSTSIFGIHSPPSYVPGIMTSFGDEMNYIERLQNFYVHFILNIIFYSGSLKYENLFWKLFGQKIKLEEIMQQTSFIFVNSDEFLEFPRPITHKVIYIGGIGIQKPKNLSLGIQKILDNATNGAVLVSFGTIARSYDMPSGIRNALLKAFRTYQNITFLWKYEENDGTAVDMENVYKIKWLPQNDILGHPNIKAFITHCGLNSVLESTRQGVPIVAIPLFSDQMHNSQMVVRKNVAVKLDIRTVTGQAIIDALSAVLYNKNIRKSAAILAKVLQKRPFTAQEKVIKYVEFAAEFGSIDHLTLASRKLNFIQIFSIDIIIPSLLILVVISVLTIRILYRFVQKFTKNVAKCKCD